MQRWLRVWAWSLVLSAILAASPLAARAQGETEFLLGVGYTRMNFDGDSPLIDDRDGVHLDPVFSFAPVEDLPQLRLGAAFGISFAVDDTRGAFVSDEDGATLFIDGDDSSLMLFEPELRISWRQALAEGEAVFVEAGVGGGGVIGWLSAGDDEGPGDPDGAELDETDAAFMARALVRFGVHVTSGIVGVEASYMVGGDLDFAEGIGGDVSEAYVGIFGALSF